MTTRELEKQRDDRTEAVRKFLSAKGDDLCWQNRQELAAAFELALPPEPHALPPLVFLSNCISYCQSLQDGTKYRSPENDPPAE
jgi:hypothetical protein